jgi:hypothetical protein
MANLNKIEERRLKEWQIKSDIELKQKIDELRRIRYGNGLDKELITYNDLLKGAFRFEPLIETLKKAEIRRGRERVR